MSTAPVTPRPARTILFVRDFEAARTFFEHILEFSLAYPSDGHWAEFTVGGAALCLHDIQDERPPAGAVSVGWFVEDLDATYTWLQGKGVTCKAPTGVTEGVRCVEFDGPEGHRLFFEGA